MAEDDVCFGINLRYNNGIDVFFYDVGIGNSFVEYVVMAKAGRPRTRIFDEEAAVQLYCEVKSSQMVAAKFGTGNDVILRLVRSRGIAVGSRGRKKLLDAGQVSRLVEMHLQGMSQREIAQEFGLSQQGIGKILRRELGKIVG